MESGTFDKRLSPQPKSAKADFRLRKRYLSLNSKQARNLPTNEIASTVAAAKRMFPNGNPYSIATELDEAINTVLEKFPNALGRVEELFVLRRSLPGLVESLPQREALIKVLSDLLKAGYKSSIPSGNTSDESARATELFVQDFKLAIVSLAEVHPTALLFFDYHRKLAGYSAFDALQGVLLTYLSRGQSLTY